MHNVRKDDSMEYIKFGNTGMDVSPICLGGMSFASTENNVHKWTLDESQSRGMIKLALEQGINFFDTANVYGAGTSEQYMGKALGELANRDEIVVATKVFFSDKKVPNSLGLSRKAIMQEIDHSLERLKMDYVDLYIIHRWDYNTPIEETMEALNDVVKSGKARYIGASAMYAWQFSKALHTSEKYGYSKFVSMQNHLNLIYREEEREMVPLCADQKIAITPYSPLAGGKLARPRTEHTKRGDSDVIIKQKYGHSEAEDNIIIDRVGEVAKKYGVKYPQVALAWLMAKSAVTAPIIGATKEYHITDAVSALELKLTPEDIAYLEEPYIPHRVIGAI